MSSEAPTPTTATATETPPTNLNPSEPAGESTLITTTTGSSDVHVHVPDIQSSDSTEGVLLRGWSNDKPYSNVSEGDEKATLIANGSSKRSSSTSLQFLNLNNMNINIGQKKKNANANTNGNGNSISNSHDGDDDTDTPVPKFQPGDHVIRWKLLKLAMWPIQIHGIVLESNVDDNGTCSVVIADFGYSSSRQNSKKGGGNGGSGGGFGGFGNIGKKGGIMSINEMMDRFYNKKNSGSTTSSRPPETMYKDNVDLSSAAAYSADDAASVGGYGDGDEDEVEDDELGNGKRRFHVRTITDPKDLKKWSKVNYGQSLFSSKGKLEKLKKFFTIPQLKKGQQGGGSVLGDGKGKYETASIRSFETDDDSYFQSEVGEIELNETTCTSNTADKSSMGDDRSVVSTSAVPDKKKQDVFAEADDILDASNMTPFEQLIAQANEIERKSISRNRFHGYKDVNSSSSSVTSASSSPSSLMPPSSVSSTRRGGGKNFLKKFSLKNLKSTTERISKQMSPAKDNYATLDSMNSNSFGDEGSVKGDDISGNKEEPKLPKADPRKIVLARVKFVLEEQDKPESDSYLPPYHIMYSNSECLAVWCKTGKFSTLQAAVFLHSTAVGNAKSTVALTAAIAATQPWLIPVVGVYGLAAVGLPYYYLDKCKKKWKVGEQRLTNGFWDQASNDVIVSAIENWSGLTPDKQENSDEK